MVKKIKKEKIEHTPLVKESYEQWAKIIIYSLPFENWGRIQWGTRWAMLLNLGTLCALHWPTKVKLFLWELITEKKAGLETLDFDILYQEVLLQKEALDNGICKRWRK